MSAAPFPSDVLPAISGSSVPENASESFSMTYDVDHMEVDSHIEISNLENL